LKKPKQDRSPQPGFQIEFSNRALKSYFFKTTLSIRQAEDPPDQLNIGVA
jgi:hypothetical protein